MLNVSREVVNTISFFGLTHEGIEPKSIDYEADAVMSVTLHQCHGINWQILACNIATPATLYLME